MKRAEVEPEHPKIPVVRQCELLGLFRASFYYSPCGEDAYNLTLMRMIDEEFIAVLGGKGVKISMDGRGRVYENIFVERFWRTVKYEEVYLHEYRTMREAREHLASYFRFYNEERLHETLGYRTPHEIYFGTRTALAPATEAMV